MAFILTRRFSQTSLFFLAIHKMTERTLAASPNIDGNPRQHSTTTNETSPSSTRVDISFR